MAGLRTSPRKLLIAECLVRRRRLVGARQAISELLESPGTKAYTVAEAQIMLRSVGFEDVSVSTKLGPGDLLMIQPSERYRGRAFGLLWKLYPRALIRAIGDRFGLYLLLSGRAPDDVDRGENP